ncbi:SAM-dependent methyltransferase [Actinoplanes oblitus]|uniref:SAM-dependent methyltransferase n=1 Tax=Actinoplanes oblitus TaxID=3040509 RepID=A0ABY8W8Q2_9ACTN|nr:SAM-dependent methyltransferase [Actinoplanes oblitus]WIM93290.1 SAM-dependent methyltransferase [Actinoplanes oblitus]
MADRRHALDRIDTTVAHPARRYNYLLGGKDNFAADRASAEAIEAAMPTIRLAALENRAFLQRAVQFLAERGIRQFLDIGTGIPSANNTHEVAQRIDPAARIVYVDNDPIVLTHARALLTSTSEGTTAYIDADLREPQSILDDPELQATLDFTRPMAVMLVAVLHFIRDDEDPQGIVDTLIDALPAGSYVVASHSTWEYLPSEAIEQLEAANPDGRFRARTGEQLEKLFSRLDLIEPGVQSVSQWWSEQATQPRPPIEDVAFNAIVGQVR